IFRYIRREAATFKELTLVINCSVDVAKLLQGEERQELRDLMDRFNKSIQVKAQQHYHREQFDVYGRTTHDVKAGAYTSYDTRSSSANQPVHAKAERS